MSVMNFCSLGKGVPDPKLEIRLWFMRTAGTGRFTAFRLSKSEWPLFASGIPLLLMSDIELQGDG